MDLFINAKARGRAGVKQRFLRFPFLRIIISLFMIAAFSISCATRPEIISKEDEREALKKRVEQYWYYQIRGQVDKTYECEVPGYREKVSLVEYLNKYKLIRYLEADIAKIEVEGEAASVSMNLTYRMALKYITQRKLTRTEQDRWIKINKVWYHIPEGFEM